MIDLKRQAELHDAMELFYFAYRRFTERPDQILEARGLGRTHHRILYFIGRRPGISVQGLLNILAISKQALNAPLRQLMAMNLVAASEGSPDRRVKNLRLTADGARLEAELTGAQMRHLESAFAAAGSSDERGWRRLLAEIQKAGEARSKDGSPDL